MARLGSALLGLLLGCGADAPPSTPAAEPAPAAEAPARAPTPKPEAPRASGVFQVDVLDVGQGDAILLRSPAGKAVLIDAGTGQQGEAALPLLEALGVTRLELVVATHGHADHIGGLDEIVNRLQVRLFTDNGLPHTTDAYDRLMKAVEAKGIAYKTAAVGQTYKLDGGVKLEILNPDGEPITGTRSDLNANSVVVRATHGANCFLFVGDAEAETEERMLERGVAPCDVLKAAHHGSGYASGAAFLEAVRPQAVLISVGAGNEYGHPDPEAMSRYAAASAQVLRTDLGGTLRAESDGRSVRIRPERGAELTLRGRGGEAGAALAQAATSEAEGESRLDLNRATAAELEALPGLGEKLARAIIEDRKKNGHFSSVDELDRVPGIGPATIAGLREHLRVAR